MRAVIGRIPDGTYEFEDEIDDDGITDKPIRIHAKVTVAGDEMTVDLSGCSPQSLGPSNATLASTCSTVFYALMASADVPVPSNAGCYRPVKIIAPPGCCVNAAAPAPVVHRIAIGHRLATVLFGALHKAVPERMPAAYYAVSYVVTFQTIDPKHGRKVLVEIEIGGCGALPYSRRRLRAFLRHAQQRQHPHGDDRERHAAHLPRLRAAAGFRRRRAPARRARPVARVAHRLPGGAALHQPRPLQVPPLRPGGRRAGLAERALSDRATACARRCRRRSRT